MRSTARHGIFSDLSSTVSNFEWGNLSGKDEKIGFCYTVTQVGDVDLIFRIRYTIGRGNRKESMDLPIQLQTTRPNFGGIFWWCSHHIVLLRSTRSLVDYESESFFSAPETPISDADTATT